MNSTFGRPRARAFSVFLALASIGSVGGTLGALAGCHSEAAEPEKDKAAEKTAVAPVSIDVAVADERAMPEYLLVTGTLLANHESRVAAGVAGKVLATYVERGQEVKKGDVLARLDTRGVSANLAEAEAAAATARTQREQAKADCARSKSLFAKGAMSQAEFDRSQSACQAAQSQAEAAEARARSLTVNVGDASGIRAPFSGFIAERDVSAGEYVQAATVVADVVETDPLRLELSVPESAATEIQAGLSVEFHLAAHEDKKFMGTIRYIGPSVRRQSRDLLVEAVVDNRDHQLIPGMFATARIHVGDPKRATVPQGAVRTEGSLHHVFVVAKNKAEDRIVQLGETVDGRTAILDGVKPGEQVALNPQQLVDGQPVTIAKAGANPGAKATPAKAK